MKKAIIAIFIATLLAILLCGCRLYKNNENPAPEPPETESLTNAVNLIESFSVEEQQIINRFVRDVITYGDIQNYPNIENVKLIEFAIDYLCSERVACIEHIFETYEARVSTALVDDILQQYLGRTIVHRTVETESGHLYKYRDGYYYWLEASGGHFPVPLAFVEALYKEQDGTYRATYSVYWIDMAISDPADFPYFSPGEWYWYYIPEKYDTVILSQVSNYPELERQGTGTIILKEHVESDGTKTYRLVSLPG